MTSAESTPTEEKNYSGIIQARYRHKNATIAYVTFKGNSIYSSLLNTPTMRSRDGVLPASYLYSLKMQGNEVEAVNTPTVRSWEVY
jgi:hypothetical protein